ncbi:unnamed protein product [Rotaria sordida]|uniref:Uncharacterized protein n=1 Tax=Rotaria sordida TaxID=392033 RepID=A0A814S1S8_9BILA|nr:unnamed protein product [Rotaria sordida]CAF1139331.1 unnamed protein product [Rotaria sordida]
MLKRLASLLRNYRQNVSEIDHQLSSTDSEDDDEIGSSTTIEETRRSPPIITWKLVQPMTFGDRNAIH